MNAALNEDNMIPAVNSVGAFQQSQCRHSRKINDKAQMFKQYRE